MAQRKDKDQGIVINRPQPSETVPADGVPVDITVGTNDAAVCVYFTAHGDPTNVIDGPHQLQALGTSIALRLDTEVIDLPVGDDVEDDEPNTDMYVCPCDGDDCPPEPDTESGGCTSVSFTME